jgi:hypothetical protein
VRQELLGQWYVGIVTSDRAKAYDTRPLRKRQLCWAHLARDVQAMIDRGGPGQAVGEALFPHWYPKLPVSLSSDSGHPANSYLTPIVASFCLVTLYGPGVAILAKVPLDRRISELREGKETDGAQIDRITIEGNLPKLGNQR